MQHKINFPFTAIVGQDDFKLCLILNTIDPSIGGVLATGDKGTGKTTTVRALSQLMGTSTPFVNLPIGATEDRVLGSVNLEALIKEQKAIVEKGLLAKAHQGFLYIDEVNLLNDYLMDVLLDASASGGYYLEREGISQWLDSRFCLVGTMNPEEGALRPQLLDRFGLNVIIQTPKEVATRKQIASQRLSFDTDQDSFYTVFETSEKELKETIAQARKTLNVIQIPDEVKEYCAQLTIENEVEGMRADILLLKTARAYAAYLGERIVTTAIVAYIAPFVLQHRAKNYTPPSDNEDQHNEEPNTENENDAQQNESEANNGSNSKFQLPENIRGALKFNSESSKQQKIDVAEIKGIVKEAIPTNQEKSIAIFKTIKQYLITDKITPVYQYQSTKTMMRIVFLIDTSASMAIGKQMGYLKGIVLKTLKANPLKKIQYAIVGLEGTQAKIIQPFTTNIEQLSEISYQLKTQGKTNLTNAFFKVFELLKSINKKTVQLFVFTDGKANVGGKNPFAEAIETYKKYLSGLSNTTVIDTESGFVKLGRAKKMSEVLQLKYLSLSSLNA
ncbi:VWA domain-containing protein [Aquimarina rhabdastrellae]